MEKKPLRGHLTFWRLLHYWGDSMTNEDFKRKLTAILSADVVSYSRLMGEDEAVTVKTLKTSDCSKTNFNRDYHRN